MLAFRSSRLLVSSADEIIEDGGIVVDPKTGKIVRAGAWADIQAALVDEAAVEDLGDVTLMPGLFDCHVHLVMDPDGGRRKIAFHRDDDAKLELMSSNALKLLDAGVTTARDLGCPGTVAVTLRNQIQSREKMGPRLQVSNAPITVPGGHAAAMGGVAQGVEAVRLEARKRIAEGADLIKVMTTGGFLTAGSHPSQARYSVEELKAIVEEAHTAGLKVTTHAQGVEGIRRAVEAGLDCIEHCAWSVKEGTRFNAEVASQIVANDVAVCPTMNTACLKECYFCPWDARETILSNLSSLRQAGARMIVGTDAGIGLCHFERYADGLTALVEAGYTPREIIHGATAGAAFECGLGEVTGKLLPGMAADLAAFEGSPLESIDAFSRPVFVMARGRRHKLRPIAPFGDRSAEIKEINQVLRAGAGMNNGST